MRIRTLAIAMALGVVTTASATGEYLDTFITHYKVAESAKLAEKSCGACHVSDSDFDFNAYGKAMAQEMVARNADTLSIAMLEHLEPLDSDGDGTPNGAEIAADTSPGDPSEGGTGEAVAGAESPVGAKKEASFPPKNAFHPAIVHFPIALFVVGLLLDFVGMVRGIKSMLIAGWYNIVLGAVSSLAGIATGVWAMGLLKLPYRGLIFDHLKYAIVATVCMWLMVAMRVHRHEKMQLGARLIYYALATACLLSISWAGHLGGVFVYGE